MYVIYVHYNLYVPKAKKKMHPHKMALEATEKLAETQRSCAATFDIT